MRSMFKLHIKHCFISQSHILLTYFVFGWVVEASAACFVDCLAYVPWWWRGLGAGFSLASFFTALLLYIDSSVTLMMLICITAYVWCFSTSCCFSIQYCSTAAYCIIIICKCIFSTFNFLNLEGFWCVDLSYSYLQQFCLLTEFTRHLHNCVTEKLTTCKKESMIKSFMCRKGMIYKYVNVLNHQ